jgi:hypothetical protein
MREGKRGTGEDTRTSEQFDMLQRYVASLPHHAAARPGQRPQEGARSVHARSACTHVHDGGRLTHRSGVRARAGLRLVTRSMLWKVCVPVATPRLLTILGGCVCVHQERVRQNGKTAKSKHTRFLVHGHIGDGMNRVRWAVGEAGPYIWGIFEKVRECPFQ